MRNLKGKRAILYRRVSTTKQKETGNSLNSQNDIQNESKMSKKASEYFTSLFLFPSSFFVYIK